MRAGAGACPWVAGSGVLPGCSVFSLLGSEGTLCPVIFLYSFLDVGAIALILTALDRWAPDRTRQSQGPEACLWAKWH